MRGSSRSRARVLMSSVVIFDTSVFVDHLRTGSHQQRIETVTGLIRTSSVVLAELWRGATKPVEREFVKRVRAKGVSCTVRDTRGREISAACGQLAAEG